MTATLDIGFCTNQYDYKFTSKGPFIDLSEIFQIVWKMSQNTHKNIDNEDLF